MERKTTEQIQKKTIGERLKGCIDTAYNILKIGSETNEELYKQREQLERIDDKIDVIDTNVKNAHRTLDNMSSYFKSLLGSVKYDVEKDKPWLVKSAGKLPAADNNRRLSGYSSEESCEDNKTQEDKDLDELYMLTLKMKQMGLSINKALDDHNEKVEEKNNKADGTNDDIQSGNRKIIKLL